MIRLSAFADEIAADLDEQIAVLQSEGSGYLDLRGVGGINVLDLTDAQVSRSRADACAAHGIGVAAIGSPIGKVPIDSAFRRSICSASSAPSTLAQHLRDAVHSHLLLLSARRRRRAGRSVSLCATRCWTGCAR